MPPILTPKPRTDFLSERHLFTQGFFTVHLGRRLVAVTTAASG